MLLDRLDDQQHQRQHLDEREHAAERHPHARAARPVEVMAGAEDAAEEDQDQLEIDRPLGQLARHQTDRHQQIGAHARGEELERLLDPQMHHPPAPEIGDRERLLDPGQRDHAEHIEDRDVDGGGPDQVFEPDAPRPELPRRLPQHRAGRPQRAEHQPAPDQQADEEADLPEPAELDVGQALIAEPEPAAVDIAHDAEPVADQRAGDDESTSPRTAGRPATPGRAPRARRRSPARGTGRRRSSRRRSR